jgi:nicotinate phosphoribosyltransferase
MNTTNDQSQSLLIDFYELTMAQSYFEHGKSDLIAGFDLFYRKNPDQANFSIMGGTDELINYISELSFSKSDIEYLRSLDTFSTEFLDYLKNFKFSGDIWAVPEGTVIFPNEPLVKVKAPIIEAQLIETFLILVINRGCLFTTKANRIARQVSKSEILLEFGARRSQGLDIPVFAPRYAYIGGFDATSSTIAGKRFGIPVSGTMAHSYVMMFEDEYTAFEHYCLSFPDNAVLLVDTFDTLESGIPNAIKAFNNVLKPMGKRPVGIRLDSGDLADLSKKAREMLNEAGYSECKIFVSNSLDEELVQSLKYQKARIDGFGIGERFATSKSSPVFGTVYKLAYIINPDGEVTNKIKLSDNPNKLTNPGDKKVYRIYDQDGMAYADILTLASQNIDTNRDITFFNELYPSHKTTFKANEYSVKELLVPIFKNGALVYKSPSLDEIKKHCEDEINTLYPGVKRLKNPHKYYVDLSNRLLDLKKSLINNHNS